jgi:hypothetical protein
MTFDDNDLVSSNEQLDPASAYPTIARAGSESTVTAEGPNAWDSRVSDREIPSRPTIDAPADAAAVAPTALFERGELDTFNGRWSETQASFVDEPRLAVQQADALVSDVIAKISDSFGAQRAQLEGQWDRGGEVSTEDLRQTFQRYRSFFSRLLDL